MNIYESIIEKKKSNKKQFALLIDPDKFVQNQIVKVAKEAQSNKVDLIFLGGSLLTVDSIDSCINLIKANCSVPVVLFPGSPIQISKQADAILYLSLISGRNPEMLIGQHVSSAPLLKQTQLEIIPTGYMLIESGKFTTVQYISNTFPIPHDKDDVAISTAIAGEMLGLKIIYMDGGSGAKNPISKSMVEKVSNAVKVPLIIGGGIKTAEKAVEICNSGADIVVVGNAIEENSSLISEIVNAVHSI